MPQLSRIEQLYKSQYDLLKWTTVIWIFWFGSLILKDWVTNTVLHVVVVLTLVCSSVIWIVTQVKNYRLRKIIQADDKLSNALNDELQKYTQNKVIIVGYWTTLLLVCTFMIFAAFITLPALLVLKVIVYVSVLSIFIASLIYCRPNNEYGIKE